MKKKNQNPGKLNGNQVQGQGSDEKGCQQICCICGNPIVGRGHNAIPYVLDGRCCNDCNQEHVIPYRIALQFVYKQRTTPPVRELPYETMMLLNKFFRLANFTFGNLFEEDTDQWAKARCSFDNQYLDGKDELFLDKDHSISFSWYKRIFGDKP